MSRGLRYAWVRCHCAPCRKRAALGGRREQCGAAMGRRFECGVRRGRGLQPNHGASYQAGRGASGGQCCAVAGAGRVGRPRRSGRISARRPQRGQTRASPFRTSRAGCGSHRGDLASHRQAACTPKFAFRAPQQQRTAVRGLVAADGRRERPRFVALRRGIGSTRDRLKSGGS
jgi:hypothetical protein